MEIIRHIKVDLYGDTQHFAVAAKQMDMGTRYIGVTLMEDGVVYEIPDNVEVIINMTKPDKTHVHNDGEKSGNEALIPLTRGMLQVHGTALCEVQLYQNGALLTSATFEMEIFPSQRDESEIIHSGEYTRLENTIAAAREALQIAQDTQNTIDAAEAVRQAQERLREAAEKAREIKESRREDDTAKAIAKCVEAMEAAIEQTKKCLTATEEANKIIISQSGLDAILAAVKDYYERQNQPTSCLSREEHRSRPIMTSTSQERHTQFEKEVKKNGNSNNHSEKGNDRRVDGEQEGSR